MRAAESWTAHPYEQPCMSASEDRASDAQEHDLLTLLAEVGSPPMACIMPKCCGLCRWPNELVQPLSEAAAAEHPDPDPQRRRVDGCQLQKRSQGGFGFGIKEMLTIGMISRCVAGKGSAQHRVELTGSAVGAPNVADLL